jgi:hypothetical protein
MMERGSIEELDEHDISNINDNITRHVELAIVAWTLLISDCPVDKNTPTYLERIEALHLLSLGLYFEASTPLDVKAVGIKPSFGKGVTD